MSKENPINETHIAASQEVVTKALVGLSPEQQQAVLLPVLEGASRRGMSDSIFAGLNGLVQREQQRRDESFTPESVSQTELLANDLAQRTRVEGMGFLTGKFPETLGRVGQSMELQTIKGFILGIEDVTQSQSPTGQSFNGNDLLEGMASREIPSYEIVSSEIDAHRQVWTSNDYIPPKESTYAIETTKGKFGRTQQHQVRGERYKDYLGQHMPEGYVQYSYYMPINHFQDKRPGIYVNLTVVVPPSVSQELDAAVAEDPYFPGKYFNALYPGYLGEDPAVHINRKPASELLVRDLRKDPNVKTGKVKYPTPLA